MSARPPTFYAWVSVATSVVVIALKFAAYFLTGSVGLLSDAVESVVNILAALIALAVLTYASEKPDHEHNFGHEKAEYFSSGIEGALIFVAAGAIVWTSVPRLVDPQPLDQVWLGLALSFVASLANAACAMLMLRAAKAHRSITLEADARHLLTDVWTTVGVFAGVVMVQSTGWLRLDPLIAIAVAIQILWTGWHLMRRSFDGLMDRAIPDEDRAVVTGILDEVRRQGGDYHALRTRVAGAKSYVNVHILVPGSMSVQDGHDLVEKLESDIAAKLPHVEVLTHLEPLEDPKSWDDPDKPLAGS
ncbi:MAG TPA: cation diffusion facilitator family transporter [Usitatibacter sp.]|jgi:cation diffusion facilitator family transporter|nr:cation diffusion facilitator family transporter [Usitatibacter sp.]